MKPCPCLSLDTDLSATADEGHWVARGGGEIKEQGIDVRERNLGWDINLNPGSAENCLCALGLIIYLL